MMSVYREAFPISHGAVDRYDRLKPSYLLALVQEVAGKHFDMLHSGCRSLEEMGLFWAVIRHRVTVRQLPKAGQTVTLETWPMPTTRVAYPRCVIARDEAGEELFRAVSLWVLMDVNTRAMVLPGKSGVQVQGVLLGGEIDPPASLVPRPAEHTAGRRVMYSELDVNAHMNNTRYLDWVEDLLSSSFHAGHSLKEFTVCYLSEATEGEALALQWQLQENVLRVDARRESSPDRPERVFSAQVLYN